MTSLEYRAHQNLVDFNRFLGRLEADAQVLDAGGVVAIRGAADFPSARTAVRANNEVTAAEFVSALEGFLFSDGKTACVSARVGADDDVTDALTGLGFQEYAQTPEMVCDARLAEQDPGAGVTVRLATNADDVRAYGEIAGSAFRHLGMPEEITARTIDNPEDYSWGFTVSETSEEEPSTIEGISVADLLRDFGWERVDLLKMDIEGAELEVLSHGAEEWLDRVHSLAVEFHFRRPGCWEAFTRIVEQGRFALKWCGEYSVLRRIAAQSRTD